MMGQGEEDVINHTPGGVSGQAARSVPRGQATHSLLDGGRKAGGGANTTAYEMMRLLEEKGYAASDYVLAEGPVPGRSSVEPSQATIEV